MNGRPSAVALVAPSGTGKTTLARALLEASDDYVFSVSATTRPPRAGERGGVDYHFVDPSEFQAMVERGELVEWAEVHGRMYGTPLGNFARARSEGRTLILDIDFQGALQIARAVPDAIPLFLLPPSGEVMLHRLLGRGTETETEVRRRLVTALDELEQASLFDLWLVNETVDETVIAVRDIVERGGRPERTPEQALRLSQIGHVLRQRLVEMGEGAGEPGAGGQPD